MNETINQKDIEAIEANHDTSEAQAAIMKIIQVCEAERERLDKCLEEGTISKIQHELNLASLQMAKWRAVMRIA